ncbi:MAG: RlmE family RNA methyltransferase [Deltaproteobacteria bacterium]|nr:RlmE family RNA methyltransferase [Deltaproteobacteria bacterium]
MARYIRKDRWYQKAKKEGYLSRAAYKLLELNQRYPLFKPGQKVLDLGCWPGGWSQVALQQVGQKMEKAGKVVGIDLAPLQNFSHPRWEFLQRDLYDASLTQEILDRFGEFDLVLCDAAPKLTGISVTDAQMALELTQKVIEITQKVLRAEGDFVLKFFSFNELVPLIKALENRFEKANRIKLEASRGGSSEQYFIGKSLKKAKMP